MYVCVSCNCCDAIFCFDGKAVSFQSGVHSTHNWILFRVIQNTSGDVCVLVEKQMVCNNVSEKNRYLYCFFPATSCSSFLLHPLLLIFCSLPGVFFFLVRKCGSHETCFHCRHTPFSNCCMVMKGGLIFSFSLHLPIFIPADSFFNTCLKKLHRMLGNNASAKL